MYWKYKAIAQEAVSYLPDAISHETYYFLKRRFGKLRHASPWRQVRIAAAVRNHLTSGAGSGRGLAGKNIVEVGTGWGVVVPVAYWLMGAESVVTFDLNRYLRADLMQESLRDFFANDALARELLGDDLVEERFDELGSLVGRELIDIQSLVDLCGIEYRAPADASKTDLASASIDIHVSNNVLEHIPGDAIRPILREGGRLCSPEGILIHRVDYSDHFAHRDKSISNINFLQYSDKSWSRFADNRFMYMNRLRHSDYIRIFLESGLAIVREECDSDALALDLLKSGKISLDSRFENYDIDELAVVGAWIVARSR